jgi:hypothetical protein
MMSGIIRITKNLSFNDLLSGSIAPVDAYRTQVHDWILSPARRLTEAYPEDTDHGMALLALELMFFEPHGHFLEGNYEQRQSKQYFCMAFERFRQFLKAKSMSAEDNDTDDLATESIYKWARCGLFHSTLLAKELLVDAVQFGQASFAKNPIISGGWLIDPWRMLDELEDYVDSYVSEVKADRDSAIAMHFEATFKKLLREPAEFFCRDGSEADG